MEGVYNDEFRSFVELNTVFWNHSLDMLRDRNLKKTFKEVGGSLKSNATLIGLLRTLTKYEYLNKIKTTIEISIRSV